MPKRIFELILQFLVVLGEYCNLSPVGLDLLFLDANLLLEVLHIDALDGKLLFGFIDPFGGDSQLFLQGLVFLAEENYFVSLGKYLRFELLCGVVKNTLLLEILHLEVFDVQLFLSAVQLFKSDLKLIFGNLEFFLHIGEFLS